MKYRMRTLILMLLMCWASQSSAQPTRAQDNESITKHRHSRAGGNPDKHQA